MGDVGFDRKNGWKTADYKKLLIVTTMVLGENMDGNKALANNRIRHCLSVSDIATDLVFAISKHMNNFTALSNYDNVKLFKICSMLHDVCKYAPLADSTRETEHGVLACDYIKSLIPRVCMNDVEQYDLILDAVQHHSDKHYCVSNVYQNPYAAALAIADMVDHTTEPYAKALKVWFKDEGKSESDLEAFLQRKRDKVNNMLSFVKENLSQEMAKDIAKVCDKF